MSGDKVKGLPNRGETFYGPNQTIDTSNYGASVGLEGQLAIFKDAGPPTTYGVNAGTRSSGEVVCKFVRNVSEFTVLGKRLVAWKAGQRGKRIAGYTDVTAEECAGVTDEFLDSNGCRNGDMCYIVVQGPALVLSPLEGDGNNVFEEGDPLYAVTAASSGATTAGRPVAMVAATTGTTGILAQLHQIVGRAMSAKTTANTNTNLLIGVDLLKGY